MHLSSRFAIVALVLPVITRAQTALPLKHTPEPTVPAITARDLMTRLYIFADDSLEGREAGTIGNVKGTDYIAAEIRRLGLVPAGDNGTYFQTIPYKTRTFDTTSTLAVGGAPLKAFTDYVALGPQPQENAVLAIVYGGELGDSTHEIAPDEARGKLVVVGARGRFTMRGATRAQLALAGAAAIALVALDSVPSPMVALMARPRGFLDDHPRGAPSPAPLFLISSAAAGRMFGVPLAELTIGAKGATATLNVRFSIAPVAQPARNVVGIISGSDPRLEGAYVALGAHSDHLGIARTPVDHDSMRIWNHIVRPEGADDAAKQATPEQQGAVAAAITTFRSRHPGAHRPDSIYNGADDDGSGSVSLLEIAEKIASLREKPKRSILFVWHTAEEKGLLGSRYFADHPTVPRDSIVAQLNMDMVGRGGADDETGRTKDSVALHGAPGYVQLVGSRRLSTELGDLIEQVKTEGHRDLTFDYAIDANGHPSNIYCRSDHYHYARYGIPIAFFTTGLHSDYHQVSDEPEYIDYEHMARVANLVADVALRVAALDHRPVVDHAKPDPNAPCRQ